MKKRSRRTQRMERNHKAYKSAGLNLISLMDIFTILVFFLLVSSSNTQQLPNPQEVQLPSSTAKKVPAETLVITVTKSQIFVEEQLVADIEETLKDSETLIKGLQEELLFQSQKRSFVSEEQKNEGYPVTIIGDERIPYGLLHKILATCRAASYTQIAFGAIQRSAESF